MITKINLKSTMNKTTANLLSPSGSVIRLVTSALGLTFWWMDLGVIENDLAGLYQFLPLFSNMFVRVSIKSLRFYTIISKMHKKYISRHPNICPNILLAYNKSESFIVYIHVLGKLSFRKKTKRGD